MTPAWISPVTGRALHATSPNVLEDDGERWPVFDAIPFLRVGRRDLADSALAAIDAGDIARAGAILLTDQDPFAPDPPPGIDENLLLLAEEPALSFREAMRRLRLGRVGDYFAHRWSDPTFLSGLVLASAFTRGTVLDFACGAGHFVREFARLGVDAIGADLVFAKLWLCRRFICPDAVLVCFDAQHAWPFPDAVLAGAFCHDAIYFIPNKPAVFGELRRCCAADATVAVGHAHNAGATNHSAGLPLTPAAYARLLGECVMFDDAALTASAVTEDPPPPRTAAELDAADAVSLLAPPRARARPPRILAATASETLRLNPLYQPDGPNRARIAWPSARYEAEYAPLATYPAVWSSGGDIATLDATEAAQARRTRVFVDLPARW